MSTLPHFDGFVPFDKSDEGINQHLLLHGMATSIQGKVSAGEQVRPLEAQYQDEYYRAFSSIMPPGVAISSEWSWNGNPLQRHTTLKGGWTNRLLHPNMKNLSTVN